MLENKWALVVEDDAHSLVAISSLLRDLGVQFKRNTTGANVSEQMRTMTPSPNFILLDIDLAGGDAFVINQRIQSDPTLRQIPVIALGSTDDFPLRQQMQRAGFAALILKPIPRRRFADLLERILGGDQVWEAAI